MLVPTRDLFQVNCSTDELHFNNVIPGLQSHDWASYEQSRSWDGSWRGYKSHQWAPALQPLLTLSLILTTTQKGRHHRLHFTGKKSLAQEGDATLSTSDRNLANSLISLKAKSGGSAELRVYPI